MKWAFDPKDIGKYARRYPVSKRQLEKEGNVIIEGKDVTHTFYGKKRPEHSEYMKTAMLGKNKGNKRPDLVERNKLGHSAEARANISKNHADVGGEKNPNYKHGLSTKENRKAYLAMKARQYRAEKRYAN